MKTLKTLATTLGLLATLTSIPCHADGIWTSNGPSLDGFVDGDQVPKQAGRNTAPGIAVCTPDEAGHCAH